MICFLPKQKCLNGLSPLVNEDSQRGRPNKFEIIHPMSDQRRIHFLESYQIQCNKKRKLINHDDGPLQSPLIDIFIDNQSNH
jgi:hypothetical protein